MRGLRIFRGSDDTNFLEDGTLFISDGMLAPFEGLYPTKKRGYIPSLKTTKHSNTAEATKKIRK